ncbi:MAG: glycine cleavage system aminomethyltransferase GcvT [Candidatus Melainabacteria bacterium]|nr:glycine cleavage system aminomethyltransferase GcvT [Candidatus Melainabacteria bacterium]
MNSTHTALAEKTTALYQNHVHRGAKMTPFAGWQMPLQFSRVLQEHAAVREAAGLFDVSHMGILVFEGPSTAVVRRFLDGLVPRDLEKRLQPGKAVYTQFLNEAGGILDDLIVYQLPPEAQTLGFQGEFLVVCNAANVIENCQWIDAHQPEKVGVRVHLQYDRFSLLALQGPKFLQVMQTVGFQEVDLPKRFGVSVCTLHTGATHCTVLAARTGYTGEDGLELIVPNAYAEWLWDTLLNQNEATGLLPVGLAARDTLRTEAALPLHGQDIGPDTTPLEAGLGWSVDWSKPLPYVGQSAIHAQQEKGLARIYHCFKLKKQTIPRPHDPLMLEGQVVGEVTSGTVSPCLDAAIGMGYVSTSAPLAPGSSLTVLGRKGVAMEAKVVTRPFYKSTLL